MYLIADLVSDYPLLSKGQRAITHLTSHLGPSDASLPFVLAPPISGQRIAAAISIVSKTKHDWSEPVWTDNLLTCFLLLLVGWVLSGTVSTAALQCHGAAGAPTPIPDPGAGGRTP
jgi:hypothetical protein